MQHLVRSSPLPVLALSLLSVSSCNTVSEAPEGSPRVEAEVEVVIGEGFYEAFEDVGGDSALVAAIDEKVMTLADFGTRFYPVPSSAYEDGMRLPEYKLIVDVRRLDVLLKQKMIEEPDEEPEVKTWVNRLACTVVASIDRNLEGRPPLPVGRSMTTVELRPSNSSEALARSTSYAVSTHSEQQLEVTDADVLEAVRRAVTRALRQLEAAIDRDLSAR